jgi:hypothetical protein
VVSNNDKESMFTDLEDEFHFKPQLRFKLPHQARLNLAPQGSPEMIQEENEDSFFS